MATSKGENDIGMQAVSEMTPRLWNLGQPNFTQMNHMIMTTKSPH